MSVVVPSDWNRIQVQAILCICHGVLLYEIWALLHELTYIYPHLIHQLNKLKHYLSNAKHVDAHMRTRLENLQMDNMRKFLMLLIESS